MYHLPLVLGVVIVALYWGVGPSLVATLTGAMLLYTVILFTPLSWSGATETDVAELVLFLAICGAISALARQTQQARLTAEQARRAAEDLAASWAQEHEQSELERQRLHVVLEVLPVGVCLVNATGQVLTRNQAERAIWDPGLPKYWNTMERFTRAGRPRPISRCGRGTGHSGVRSSTDRKPAVRSWSFKRPVAISERS